MALPRSAASLIIDPGPNALIIYQVARATGDRPIKLKQEAGSEDIGTWATLCVRRVSLSDWRDLPMRHSATPPFGPSPLKLVSVRARTPSNWMSPLSDVLLPPWLISFTAIGEFSTISFPNRSTRSRFRSDVCSAGRKPFKMKAGTRWKSTKK